MTNKQRIKRIGTRIANKIGLKKRSKESYNQEYLRRIDTIERYKKKNLEEIKKYQNEYQKKYRQNNSATTRKTVFWGQVKHSIARCGYLPKRLNAKFITETGVSFSQFCDLHNNVIGQWLRGENTIEVSHIFSKKSLENIGFLDGANYYKNIIFLTREQNRSFNSKPVIPKTADTQEIMSGIAWHALHFKSKPTFNVERN